MSTNPFLSHRNSSAVIESETTSSSSSSESLDESEVVVVNPVLEEGEREPTLYPPHLICWKSSLREEELTAGPTRLLLPAPDTLGRLQTVQFSVLIWSTLS